VAVLRTHVLDDVIRCLAGHFAAVWNDLGKDTLIHRFPGILFKLTVGFWLLEGTDLRLELENGDN